MGKKHLVKADGTDEQVDLTPEEEAQAVLDAQRHTERQVKRVLDETRKAGFLADVHGSIKGIDAESVTDFVTAKDCLKRVEVALVKLLALAARE